MEPINELLNLLNDMRDDSDQLKLELESERAKSLKYRELLDLIIDPNNIHDPNRIKDAYKEALQALKDYK